MTRTGWAHIGGIAAALGGLGWLAKIAVIVATDGRVDSEGAAAVFFVLGAALMALGSTAIGVLVARRRARWVLALAVVASPILFVVSFAVLDGITKPLVSDRGPAYWEDEAGILVTGLAWLVIGIALVKLVPRSNRAEPMVHVRDSSGSGTVTVP